MPRYTAGQEIDSYCTRCRMDLLHKIIAVVADKPAKVECRTCYGVHQFRLPKGIKNPGDEPPPSVEKPRTRSTESSRGAALAASQPLIPPIGATIHPYRITDKFAPGTWIQHKNFGVGHVTREPGPGKIEVRFEDETRILIHEKRD